MALLTHLVQVLYDSQFGTSLRESQYVFPIVEGTHLLGLTVSFGLIGLTDLRLMGVLFRDEPVDRILLSLRPWVLSGFLVTFASGALLFCAEGAEMIRSDIFLAKLVVILLAGLNVAFFELRLGHRVHEWGGLTSPPRGVRLAGWMSLTLWTAVVILGRLIPYFT